MSLPAKDGIEYDFDSGVEFGSGPSDEVHYQIILYADRAVLQYLMLKKDINSVYLVWYLLLQTFDFNVQDKATPVAKMFNSSPVTLTDPEPE